MSFIKKYSDKLYLKQWGIGFMKGNLADIIRHKKTDLSFDWFTLGDKGVSKADPFVFKTDDGRINILFEYVSTYNLDGRISLMVCNDQLEPVMEKIVLDTKDHLSYPYVFKENGKIYVFPENAFGGSLYCYEFDQERRAFRNRKVIMELPLLDSTIIKHDSKYWLFATMLGDSFNSDLHIFYADSLFGPYTPHIANPVKSDVNGSRPAGNFIEVDDAIYRPSQNCRNYYGESITINKIKTLTTDKFEEEEYMIIEPNKNNEFNYGIHTINALDDIIIVDGQKGYFEPVRQLRRKLKNIFS
jgi:hypothetical protein